MTREEFNAIKKASANLKPRLQMLTVEEQRKKLEEKVAGQTVEWTDASGRTMTGRVGLPNWNGGLVVVSGDEQHILPLRMLRFHERGCYKRGNEMQEYKYCKGCGHPFTRSELARGYNGCVDFSGGSGIVMCGTCAKHYCHETDEVLCTPNLRWFSVRPISAEIDTSVYVLACNNDFCDAVETACDAWLNEDWIADYVEGDDPRFEAVRHDGVKKVALCGWEGRYGYKIGYEPIKDESFRAIIVEQTDKKGDGK